MKVLILVVALLFVGCQTIARELSQEVAKNAETFALVIDDVCENTTPEDLISTLQEINDNLKKAKAILIQC